MSCVLTASAAAWVGGEVTVCDDAVGVICQPTFRKVRRELPAPRALGTEGGVDMK